MLSLIIVDHATETYIVNLFNWEIKMKDIIKRRLIFDQYVYYKISRVFHVPITKILSWTKGSMNFDSYCKIDSISSYLSLNTLKFELMELFLWEIDPCDYNG